MTVFPLPKFYPILDTGLLARGEIEVEAAAEALLAAGSRIVQLRHKGHWPRQLFEISKRIASLCAGSGAAFVINDRCDIAALTGAGAVHLGQQDLTPEDARRVTPERCALGFSTHNEAQIRAAVGEPVNYLALGPIFATGSKENPDPVVGVAELRRLRGLTALPLVAIGGITRENAPLVWAAGADSVAVIGDLIPLEGGAEALAKRAAEWVELAR